MDIKKLTGMLLLVSAGQFLMGICLFAGMGSRIFGDVSPVIWVYTGLILLSSLITILGIYIAGRYRDQSYEESMKNLESLNAKLREQKHDLMNHFQVVYGLMELEEYEEAHTYIKPVFKEIQKINRAMKTAQPAVNALLQAKMEAAEQQSIDLYLEVGTALKDIPVKPWDLCRILANLLDNAMTALERAEGEKRIRVRMMENSGEYLLEVTNNGPAIEEQLMPFLFKAGFSTKKEEGHGQGLAIVARLVKEAGGSVSAESEPGETCFLVRLPKGRAAT